MKPRPEGFDPSGQFYFAKKSDMCYISASSISRAALAQLAEQFIRNE
jgi:hypothetical protein